MKIKKLLCIAFALFAALPVFAAKFEHTIYTVDLKTLFKNEAATTHKEQINIIFALTNIQGLANRQTPQLYLFAAKNLTHTSYKGVYPNLPKYYDQFYYIDKFWFNWFKGKGYIDANNVKELNSLDEIFTVFADKYKGFIVWEKKNPALLNVCASIAAAEDMVAFSQDLDNGALLKKLAPFAKKTVYADSFGIKASEKSYNSQKLATYLYLKENYLDKGRLNPFCFSYLPDAYCYINMQGGYGKNNYDGSYTYKFQNNGHFNFDYAIAKKSVIVDLAPSGGYVPVSDRAQKKGGDFAMWNKLLQSSYDLRKGKFGIVDGFVPWWLKYSKHGGDNEPAVGSECSFIELITSYNMANDADAALGLSNASFFMHMPKPDKNRFISKPENYKNAVPEKGVMYLCFFMLDYDGSAWLNQCALTVFGQKRGIIPLNWSINPALADRVPHAFEYMLDNKTNLDFFGIADDGAAYISPETLFGKNKVGTVKSDSFKEYFEFAKKYYQSQSISITPMYISRKFSEDWLGKMADLNPDGMGVPVSAKIGGNAGFSMLVNNIALAYLHTYHLSNSDNFAQSIKNMYAIKTHISETEPQFRAFRLIKISPECIVGAIEQAKAKNPNAKIKVVDAYTFFAMLKNKKEANPVEYDLDDYEKIEWKAGEAFGLFCPREQSDGAISIDKTGLTLGENTFKSPEMRHLYFDIKDDFADVLKGKNIVLAIEFEPIKNGKITLQYGRMYDKKKERYFSAGTLPMDSGKLSFKMENVLFKNGQNGASDFRFVMQNKGVFKLKKIEIRIR